MAHLRKAYHQTFKSFICYFWRFSRVVFYNFIWNIFIFIKFNTQFLTFFSSVTIYLKVNFAVVSATLFCDGYFFLCKKCNKRTCKDYVTNVTSDWTFPQQKINLFDKLPHFCLVLNYVSFKSFLPQLKWVTKAFVSRRENNSHIRMIPNTERGRKWHCMSSFFAVNEW